MNTENATNPSTTPSTFSLPTVEVKFEVGSYNERRLSKPWIAKIESWDGEYPSLKFGYSEYSYASLSDVEPGTLIKYGQKDRRNWNQHKNEFGIVCSNGSIERLTRGEAKKMWAMAKKLGTLPKVTYQNTFKLF